MRWWGWGEDAHAGAPPAAGVAWLQRELGMALRDAAARPSLSDVVLSAPALGDAATQLFDGPDALHVRQFHIDNAGIEHSVTQQRLSFLGVQAMNDPILLRIENPGDGLRHFGMLGYHQECLHPGKTPICLSPCASFISFPKNHGPRPRTTGSTRKKFKTERSKDGVTA